MEAKHRMRQQGTPKAEWPSEAQLAQKAGVAWFARRAATHGFAIEPDQVRVDSYEVHTFHAPEERKICFATCDFTGLLTVTSVDAFLAVLRQGLGPAKGFGCGLFLIRRAR
jgi:CRISPR system Cascade subunit CasE